MSLKLFAGCIPRICRSKSLAAAPFASIVLTLILCLGVAPYFQASSSEAAAPPAEISYAAFLTWVKGDANLPPANNTRELMSRMPRELRGSFTLVYQTRSPHQASVDVLHPRLILFSPAGDLLLAFTGDPDKPNFDVIEAIHFEPKTASFATSRFVLPAAAERDPLLREAARSNGELNRSECTRCHGEDPRPIFDGYGLWPGFYGSRGDTLSLHLAERENYLEFLATVREAPRAPYRLLEWSGSRETGPYRDVLPPSEETSVQGLPPNTRLGMVLTELNRQRIFRTLKASPHYARLKYALVSGLVGCTPMPASQLFEKRVVDALEVENAARLKRGGVTADVAGSERFFLQELQPSLLRNVVEVAYMAHVLGVDRSHWSMAFESGSLALYDGILSGDARYYVKRDFLVEMLRDIARSDMEIAGLSLDFRSPVIAGTGGQAPRTESERNEPLCRLLKARNPPEVFLPELE